MMQQHNYAIMGACAAAICTPPLGLGLATLLNRKVWTDEQRESGLGRPPYRTALAGAAAPVLPARDGRSLVPCRRPHGIDHHGLIALPMVAPPGKKTSS